MGCAMQRRDFLKGTLGLGSGLSLWSSARPARAMAAGQPPNIVFIHVDDMDADELGAYGGKVLTPHMDSIARQGCSFSRAYVNSALCVPSRYGTLTGRVAARSPYLREKVPADTPLNIVNIFASRPGTFPPVIVEEDVTLANLLNNAGYVTGLFGKYHNSEEGLHRDRGPVRALDEISSESDPTDPEVNRLIRRRYRKVVREVRDSTGFDVVERVYFDNKESMGLPGELQFDNMPWITEGALRFLDANADRPFFLYFSAPLPHRRIRQAGKNVMEHKVEENMVTRDLRATPSGWLDAPPAPVQPSREDVIKRVREAGCALNSTLITWLDDSVGAILNKLESLGLEKDTFIVFLSDHQTRAKRTNHELGVRTPMILKWPGHIRPGTRSDALVSSLDIAPTLAAVAGTPVREEWQGDGRSLVPLIRGAKNRIHESLLLEQGYSRAVVTPRWKYIALRYPPSLDIPGDSREYYIDGKKHGWGLKKRLRRRPHLVDRDQLYDLEKDPEETNNLFGEPGYARITRVLQDRLREHLKDHPHPFGEFSH